MIVENGMVFIPDVQMKWYLRKYVSKLKSMDDSCDHSIFDKLFYLSDREAIISKRSIAEYERIVQKLGEVVQGERCKSYLNTALFYDLQILKYRSNR
ncbi:hypothetical protein B0I26_11279 [Anoxybacillus vitaminiphilus]|uniref:Uncharacterized protein n=1 Tax=Paranoxybacillus vitaminiphilus TaxID=581036 RepID=A0A327YA26_9BACL|nr:hypothetical protein [Anoxybacillus vitaminiphilus]RAK17357.1 hypothetical protein B0I26_11279 [Anoxybacillus vitaminiphilus]